MKDTRLSADLIDAQADIVGQWLAGGRVDLYSGARPKWPEDEPVGDLVGSISFSDPAFMPAVDGTIVSYPVLGAICYRPGKIAWARVVRADDRAVMDLSVGKAGANINLNEVSWNAIGPVVVAGLAYSHNVSRKTEGT